MHTYKCIYTYIHTYIYVICTHYLCVCVCVCVCVCIMYTYQMLEGRLVSCGDDGAHELHEMLLLLSRAAAAHLDLTRYLFFPPSHSPPLFTDFPVCFLYVHTHTHTQIHTHTHNTHHVHTILRMHTNAQTHTHAFFCFLPCGKAFHWGCTRRQGAHRPPACSPKIRSPGITL